MVSHQTHRRLAHAIIYEPIKHPLGIGTAVDVIPEKNPKSVRCGMIAQILVDPL